MGDEVQAELFGSVKMRSKIEERGAARAGLRLDLLLVLSIMAGVLVALGAILSTALTAGVVSGSLATGSANLLGGLGFCLGIVAVAATGAELFMGDAHLLMAFAGGRVKVVRLLLNWVVVYLGNAFGAVLMAGAMYLARYYTQGQQAMGVTALFAAEAKCAPGFGPALILGIVGGVLIGLAMWLCARARTLPGKVLALLFPIVGLVAGGFEYAIANLYWVPFGLFIRHIPATSEYLSTIGLTPDAIAQYIPDLTWGNFLLNSLLPVTLGNLIGGAGLVGLVYWFINVRPHRVVQVKKEKRVPNILVVDDDPDFVDVTSMILDKEGYQIGVAYNGKEAWDSMTAKKPDMVLLDVMMSTTLEGIDLARRMAANARLKDVPIIMISSIDSSYHAGKLPDNIHLPIDAWLSKPVNPEQLLRTVRRFLA